MGKGDKKSKKGKISAGSYGVTRKRKKAATFVAKPKAKKSSSKELLFNIKRSKRSLGW